MPPAERLRHRPSRLIYYRASLNVLLRIIVTLARHFLEFAHYNFIDILIPRSRWWRATTTWIFASLYFIHMKRKLLSLFSLPWWAALLVSMITADALSIWLVFHTQRLLFAIRDWFSALLSRRMLNLMLSFRRDFISLAPFLSPSLFLDDDIWISRRKLHKYAHKYSRMLHFTISLYYSADFAL